MKEVCSTQNLLSFFSLLILFNISKSSSLIISRNIKNFDPDIILLLRLTYKSSLFNFFYYNNQIFIELYTLKITLLIFFCTKIVFSLFAI